MWAIGTVVGPLLGGGKFFLLLGYRATSNLSLGFAQSSHSGWRWIFWINLPIIGIGAIATILFLKVRRLDGQMLVKVRRFDWFGSTIFGASTVSFLIPVTWGNLSL